MAAWTFCNPENNKQPQPWRSLPWTRHWGAHFKAKSVSSRPCDHSDPPWQLRGDKFRRKPSMPCIWAYAGTSVDSSETLCWSKTPSPHCKGISPYSPCWSWLSPFGMRGCPYRQVTSISSTALNMKILYWRNKLLIFLVHARSKAW